MSLLLVLILSLTVALPAQAAFCRQSHQHQICILSIQRSAKNYWEYRTVISIDGVKKPLEVYNCRDRTKIQPDKTIVPFEPNGAGNLICNVLKKTKGA